MKKKSKSHGHDKGLRRRVDRMKENRLSRKLCRGVIFKEVAAGGGKRREGIFREAIPCYDIGKRGVRIPLQGQRCTTVVGNVQDRLEKGNCFGLWFLSKGRRPRLS